MYDCMLYLIIGGWSGGAMLVPPLTDDEQALVAAAEADPVPDRTRPGARFGLFRPWRAR